jgi:hypothetical protein
MAELRHPVRIANCSGFFGDRLSAAREQVEGGPIDVLTGDWLAELTMLILARQRLAHGPGSGYARTFLTQMEQVLGHCLDRGVKVVSNAGGLDPAGCADALSELAERLGLEPRIAYVDGDDLLARLTDPAAQGALTGGADLLRNTDTGEPYAVLGMPPLTANAYLGGFGIAAALEAGADVVVTGRVTDAALVVGPATWWHRWKPSDLDALAGAVVAGHVIECGAQATGGNYAFFGDVPGLAHVGFPIAEVAADGSSVITKHDGTGGLVSVGTVTAQLLYEIAGPAYPNPDVTARFDTVSLAPAGPNRVAVSGVRGSPPPATLKVAVTTLGGFRNTATFVLTGLDLDAKAAVLEAQLREVLSDFAGLDVQLLRRVPVPPEGVATEVGQYAAQAELRVTVRGKNAQALGKAFTAPAVELALASVPGLYAAGPPQDPAPYGIYWPAAVDATLVEQRVVLDGVQVARIPAAPPGPLGPPGPLVAYGSGAIAPDPYATARQEAVAGKTVQVAFGSVFGARSGDKGGDANIGVWARSPAAYGWLRGFLTAERVHELLPETRTRAVDVHPLANLLAVNVVVHGLLGRGVAENTAVDPQGKGLGEYLRAKTVELPSHLVEDGEA